MTEHERLRGRCAQFLLQLQTIRTQIADDAERARAADLDEAGQLFNAEWRVKRAITDVRRALRSLNSQSEKPE
jgi:hypothetical protein